MLRSAVSALRAWPRRCDRSRLWRSSVSRTMLRRGCTASGTGIPLELQRHPTPIRSAFLTIFRPSFGIAAAAICRLERGTDRVASNKPSMVLAENAVCKGSGNADEQRHGWSSWWGGASRWSPGRSGCVPAHPAYWRASASYRPLRAVWALRAWALRGTRDRQEPLSAWNDSASAKGTLQ
jgi:hypothetical protein